MRAADRKYVETEASKELQYSWFAEGWEEDEENEDYEEEYLRNRLFNETGVRVLEEEEIQEKFNIICSLLHEAVVSRYHLDYRYHVSEYEPLSEKTDLFYVAFSKGYIKVTAIPVIDDSRGGQNICLFQCVSSEGKQICSSEITYQNGDGYEGEDGAMVPTISSELDDTQLGNR